MKVNESSKTVAEYNAKNADAIAMGLMEAWEVSERMLQQEAEAERLRKAEFVKAESIKAVLAQLGANEQGEVNGVRLSIEEQRTGGGRWSSGHHTGWKLHIGGRWGDNRKWMVIGNGTQLGLTAKQKATFAEKLAEVASIAKARNDRQNEEAAKNARYKAFVAVPENKALVGVITGTSYVSDYGEKYFHVNADGTLYYNGRTFTVAQWQKIAALKQAHATEMLNLYNKYEADNKAAAQQ